jgi:alanyl-tRNA synthetase
VSELPAYERDSRLIRLETSVIEAGTENGEPYVVLGDTVLYPEGGGQPADRGRVGGIIVTDVRKSDGVILHILEQPLETGDVTVELDWARRFDHMQQHTAQHLLTAVAADRFGWPTTAFHLGEHVSDVELDVAAIDEEQLRSLENAVAAEVRAARPVTARRVSRDEYERTDVRSRGLPAGHAGDVRLVEIDGVDLNTCGGTHCSSTAELEAIKLLGTESLRGGTRVFYVAGERLRRRLGQEVERTAALRGVLGAADDELIGAAELRIEQVKDGARTVRRLEEELATALAHQLAARPGPVAFEHLGRHSLPFLQRVARELTSTDPQQAVLLTAGEGEVGFFLLAAGEGSEIDVSELGLRIADALEGKGGGKGGVFQGRANRLSNREAAAALLA